MTLLLCVSPHEFINEMDFTVEMDVSVLCVSCRVWKAIICLMSHSSIEDWHLVNAFKAESYCLWMLVTNLCKGIVRWRKFPGQIDPKSKERCKKSCFTDRKWSLFLDYIFLIAIFTAIKHALLKFSLLQCKNISVIAVRKRQTWLLHFTLHLKTISISNKFYSFELFIK